MELVNGVRRPAQRKSGTTLQYMHFLYEGTFLGFKEWIYGKLEAYHPENDDCDWGYHGDVHQQWGYLILPTNSVAELQRHREVSRNDGYGTIPKKAKKNQVLGPLLSVWPTRNWLGLISGWRISNFIHSSQYYPILIMIVIIISLIPSS